MFNEFTCLNIKKNIMKVDTSSGMFIFVFSGLNWTSCPDSSNLGSIDDKKKGPPKEESGHRKNLTAMKELDGGGGESVGVGF